MEKPPPNRIQNLLTNKRRVQFNNPMRRFDLDRIIQEYEADRKESPDKESPDEIESKPIFSLNKSIKISPPPVQEPKKRYRKQLELDSLEPYKSNRELTTQLRLKTLSNRYKPTSQDDKLAIKSIELEGKSSRGSRHMLESLTVKARAKHSSLVMDQRRSDISVRAKSKDERKYKWSHRTRKGYHPYDPHKPNQDEYLIKTFKNTNKCLFAVADGHGPNGHLIAQFTIHRLEECLKQETSDNHILSFCRAYNKMQDDLYKTNLFDASLSGTTLLSVLVDFPKLICANTGDSRAVLARKLDKQSWELVHISEDHKPSLPKERKRILKKGGRIHSFKDEQGFGVGPLRVWLPTKNQPGLAMSRSLGDNLSKAIGVTHEPQVVELQIEEEDKFLIMGTDGVWENISSSQILNFLVPLYNQGRLEQCSDTLLHLCLSSSIRRPNDPIDDITFIIVFLNKPS